MTTPALRRRCESMLDGIEIPQPFDVFAFADEVGHRRGRPLTLLPKEDLLGPCGAWIATSAGDYVFYDDSTSGVHREQIILHELGHLIAGHLEGEGLSREVIRLLMPNLDPDRVQWMLGRTVYSRLEEQEAEVLATLIQRRAVDRAAASSEVGSVAAIDVALRGRRG